MDNQEVVNKQNLSQTLYLFVVKRSETLRIPVRDILYIESSAHKLHLHTRDSVYEYNDKMNHVAELLEPEGFIRCHQSYLVQIAAVTSVRSDKLFVSEHEIQISRKYKDSVRMTFAGTKAAAVKEKVYLSEQDNPKAGSLLCVNGPYTGKLYGLVPEQEVLIGRDGEACDIVVNLPKVSRRHLKIIYHKKQGFYEITDLSTNGTYINGEIQLEKNVRYEVEPGETVELGSGVTTFKLL